MAFRRPPRTVSAPAAGAGRDRGIQGARSMCRASARLPVVVVVLIAAAVAAHTVACGRDDVATVARIDGETVVFADFEAFVRTHAGDDWMALEGDALRALFRQFLDELLLARMARDEGLADAGSDRVGALTALRQRLVVEPVANEEVRRHLEAHPDELRRPERVVLGQLLLPDRALAEEASRAVRERRDFAAVAEEMGRRPGAVYGGYTEDVSRQDLPPEFRDVLFALAPGQVSGVLEADYGYHLFHVRERRPEEVLPFEQAAKSAVRLLEREHADRAIEDMLAEARKRYPVEVLDWNLPFLWEVDQRSGAGPGNAE